LQALKEKYGWQDNHEVVCPALTFVASYNIILHNNMVPVLADIDPVTYNLDPWALEEAITDDTRCVVAVHLFGQPCDMTAIDQVVRIANWNREDEEKIRIIEDSCETMFAEHNGKVVGSWGDVACFSMYVAHILTTGVGGISTTNDPDLAMRMRSLVNHGRDGIFFSDDHSHEQMSRRFRFTSIGHSFRITELEAALGVAQLETWPVMIGQRQKNARYLISYIDKHLSEHLQTPSIAPGNTHSFMMLPLFLEHGDKWKLCDWLESNGIETRECLPLTNQPVYNINQDLYPEAKWINEQGFYIACHQGLSKADLDWMLDMLQEYAYETQ
jgi:dTDP-4-amino-4,6-dideoxygalactose transaminase